MTHTMSSLPVMMPYSDVLDGLKQHDVLVYYSKVDPQQSVVPSVGGEFSNMVCWNYAITVLGIGFIKLALDAMNAMSNEPRLDSRQRRN